MANCSDTQNNVDKKNSNCIELTKQEQMIPRSFIRGTSGHLLQQLNEFRKNEQVYIILQRKIDF